jgi:spore germination protein YaaH
MRNLVLALAAASIFTGLTPAYAATPSPTPTPSDSTHPRITQEAGNAVAGAPVGATRAIGSAGFSGAVQGSFGPSREVFGFGLASSLSDPTYGYPTWDFSVLTTVAFFGLHVQDDGTIAGDSGWAIWNSNQLSGLVSTAHGHGAKVVLTIILQDFGAGTPHMCAALTHYATTVSSTVNEMRVKGVDGVNVDYEGLNGSCGTSNPNWARQMYTFMISQLRAALGSSPFLTVDTYASSAADPVGFFDIGGLNPYVDAFFVMAYDLEYSNYSHPPTSCSNFCLGPTAPLTAYYYNDTNTVNQYVSVVAPAKVILGVPYYGRKACVGSATPNATPTGSVAADMYLDASTESSSSEVQPGSFVSHRDANDPSGQERWDTWYNTTLGCTRELYWDDAVSLSHKYDLINASNVRGVGIWTLNYGGGAPELWQLLSAKFKPATPWSSLGGVFLSGPAASSWASNRIDVWGRGSDNQLWQDTYNGSTWGGWTPLGGVINAPPGAVSWSTGRVDVFARGQDNSLWHRWWDGTAWSGWTKMGGVLNSGPTVASWAAQRLDIFVVGQDSALWHLWWDGRQWNGWQRLGGVLNSQPSAVSWGSNRIDIFARGQDGQMWHLDWSGTQWMGWQPMGGQFNSGPAAASCAAGHLDVYAVGVDKAMWRDSWNGTQWTGWTRQGGYWSNDPGAVCPPATNSANVFDVGPDDAMWQTTMTGG